MNSYKLYFVALSLLSQTAASLILLLRKQRARKGARGKVILLALWLLFSVVVQSFILMLLPLESYTGLLFIFIFFTGHSFVPIYLRYSGLLSPAFSSKPDATFQDFCERFEISQREAEIISEICNGLTNKEIADRLYISLQTVKDHTHRIYIKTGSRNRVDLITRLKGLETG